MLLEKRENCVLTVDDFSVIRSKNTEEVVLNILKDKFEGICYKKAFIHEVTKILKLSDFEFNQNDISNCSFNIEVLFVCRCEYFVSDEPVLDMKILSMKNNSITLGSDNKIAVVKEFKSEEVKPFSVGDILPVKSMRCIYEPGSNKIKMGCVLMSNESYSAQLDNKSTDIIYSVIPSAFQFSFLHGISSYSDKEFDSEIMKELKNNSIYGKELDVSFSELLQLMETESSEPVVFSYDNVYGNNIIIHKSKDSKNVVEVDSAFVFGIVSQQYILRRTVNELDRLSKSTSVTKNILQSYYKKYYRDKQ